jgi:phosphodiesterase/alkaline phosphatase D-like protein
MRGTRVRALRTFGAAIGSLLIVGTAGAVPKVGFPDGVASGDVTASTAVLWTRVDTPTPIRVEISPRMDFRGRPAFEQTVHPSTGDDLTVNVRAAGLEPATTYFYRFRHGSAKSAVGTFTTAPSALVPAPVSFAFAADADYLQQFLDGNQFEIFDAIRLESGLDFWIYLGDTVYADSSLRPLAGLPAQAETLDEYRQVYRESRALPALPDLLRSLPTYVTWDDHEIVDDYDGQTVDPARYANGRKAFFEYMPTMEVDLLQDPSCAGDPIFRSYRWGSDVEVFVLDERSCRSGDVEAACATSPVTVDFAPTLPDLPAPYDFRTQTRSMLLSAGLPASQVDLIIPLQASPACLEAISDPARTVLGPIQKQALKDALLESTAPFKVIVNEYPIFQFFALPYDRWEGYAAERAELLRFIRDNVPGETFFVSSDIHASMIAPVAVDAFLDPGPVAMDFVTGSVAAFTFEEQLAGIASQLGVPAEVVVAGFHSFLAIGGVECRNLAVDSFGRVDVDPVEGTARVELKDADGLPVLNASPLDPGDTSACTWTIGP